VACATASEKGAVTVDRAAPRREFPDVAFPDFEIATQMVTRYGMVEPLGPRTYAPPRQPFLTGTTADRIEASEATARKIDIAARDVVVKAFDLATDVLRKRRADLDQGARLLLARETVTADQFPAISSAGPQAKSAA
jgi:cell division protease FtsH